MLTPDPLDKVVHNDYPEFVRDENVLRFSGSAAQSEIMMPQKDVESQADVGRD